MIKKTVKDLHFLEQKKGGFSLICEKINKLCNWQGPCRREMEDTLNNLKILNVLSPRGLHIPNCDKKGFYKKKQVS